VLVLSTGGTISSRQLDGALVAADRADQIVTRLRGAQNAPGEAVEIGTEDVMRKGSYLLTTEDMMFLARRVRQVLEDPQVDGVVVTHGTDTMEESAYLVDLVHDDRRPVVFTGAQRAADTPDSDGPRNLADAVLVASHPDARDLGSLIVFGGEIFPASGTTKRHTLASAAFGSNGVGPVGSVWAGVVSIDAKPRRLPALKLEEFVSDPVRVAVVSYYSGVDTAALSAVDAAGAKGVVLEATGAGNANPDFCREVERLSGLGVVVALSSRVARGPVAALYGAGGGIDLVAAGAIPVGNLRTPQARILLFALLSSGRDPDEVREEIRRRLGEVPSVPHASSATGPLHGKQVS
jgi:L-asparaginase